MRQKRMVENRNTARLEAKEILNETDRKATEAEEMVEDLESVTRGLQGILEGGISKEDNRRLENIIENAKFESVNEFNNADQKREKFLLLGEEWRDVFYDASRNKKMDEHKLDTTLSRIRSSLVKNIVKGAVDHAREEKNDYSNMGTDTDRETKDDRNIQKKQQAIKNICKTINVKVG